MLIKIFTPIALFLTLITLSCPVSTSHGLHHHKRFSLRTAAKLVVPPPPVTYPTEGLLSFEDQCALIAYSHLMGDRPAGMTDDQIVEAAWKAADQMGSERDKRRGILKVVGRDLTSQQ